MALLAGGPLLVGVLGCLLGGYLTDRHVRRTGDRKWGRRLYGVIGFTGAARLLRRRDLGAMNGNMWVFAAGVAMAGFFNDLTMGPSWAVCQDIGRRYAAIVSGFMNMIGNLLGGVTTIIVTGGDHEGTGRGQRGRGCSHAGRERGRRRERVLGARWPSRRRVKSRATSSTCRSTPWLPDRRLLLAEDRRDQADRPGTSEAHAHSPSSAATGTGTRAPSPLRAPISV